MPVWAYLARLLARAVDPARSAPSSSTRRTSGPAARSVIIEDRGPLALLFLNNNFHAVHHANPKLPWYRLPAEYARRREEWLRRNGGYGYRSYARGVRALPAAAQGPGGAPDLDPARAGPSAGCIRSRGGRSGNDRRRSPPCRCTTGRSCAGATDRLWAALRDALRAAGVAAPEALTRDRALMAGWTDPAAGARADLRAAAGARARRAGRGGRRARLRRCRAARRAGTAARWWCAPTTRATTLAAFRGARLAVNGTRFAVGLGVDPAPRGAAGAGRAASSARCVVSGAHAGSVRAGRRGRGGHRGDRLRELAAIARRFRPEAGAAAGADADRPDAGAAANRRARHRRRAASRAAVAGGDRRARRDGARRSASPGSPSSRPPTTGCGASASRRRRRELAAQPR